MAGGEGMETGSRHPVKIFANIFISFIGAGVLGLPFAFKEAGILEGIFVMTSVGILSVKAMMLIVDCKYKLLQDKKVDEHRDRKHRKYKEKEMNDDGLAEKVEIVNLLSGDQEILPQTEEHKPEMSYGDVGYYAIGHSGRVLVDVAILVSQTGFCCAYLIFITENLSDYMRHMRLIHWLLVLLPPLCLLTFIRHLGSLAINSLMAQCSNLLAFAVVIWFDFDHLHKIEIHPKKISLNGLPFFLAISIYCYEGAGMILSLESSLAEDVRHSFKKYFISTMVIVTSMYISFGACGYLSFGKETNEIITLNLPKGDSIDFAMIVKSCLCLALFFTYPVMMFPVMKILEGYLFVNVEKQIWKGNALRLFMVLVTGLTVTIIPNFANLMALVGATCCTLLAFILPGLFHLSIFKGSLSIGQVVMDWTLIFIGTVGTIVCTVDALKRLQESHELKLEDFTASNMTSTTLHTLLHPVSPSP
ncbi:amino acid transporter ANTL1-like isoform X2 [Mizuhopecten yessoensis]|uniref:Proton-coupled amino acid transporter 4 n=1 Tax=Mizuhopecten yessoensis TaxID=6573 RepID=A0A210Q8T1_MIZYE|nr:amino acid transporter ANTL1-like isoform X2 [Mizuhopecten yessoensis]OWF45131.1 Proton-coupled amino acid transporter 4 [Mizuhopecten yessoensis]